MRIFAISIVVIVITSLLFLFLRPEFNSAFEADQQCHFELSIAIDARPEIGCDHDIETRQWVLFDKSDPNKPAEVVKRFRY